MNKKLDKFYSENAYTRIFSKYFTKKEFRSYKSYFLKEKKKYFNHLKFNNKSIVLDVGTGRQSVALSTIFSRIDHFDISKKHVLQLKKFTKKKKILNIFSKRVDLEHYKLEKNRYDFINLDGILMHTSNPFLLLKNVLNSLKKNGTVKILIYKSGSLKFIIISFLRKLIYENKLKLPNKFKNIITKMLFEDDLYVPNIHFFDENSLYKFLKKMTSSSKFLKTKNFNFKKKIDTKNFHHSLTFIATKKNDNLRFEKNTKLKYLNQLNKNFLKKDKFFYDNIGKRFLHILEKNKKSGIPKFKIKEIEFTIIRIYKIALHSLFYKELNYKNLISILKVELYNLEQLLINKRYD